MPEQKETRWDSKTPPRKPGSSCPKNKGGTPPPPQNTKNGVCQRKCEKEYGGENVLEPLNSGIVIAGKRYGGITVVDRKGGTVAVIRDGKLNESDGYHVVLEAYTKDLKNNTTEELVTELRKREGVETTVADPYQDVEVKASGPAIILVVTD